MLDAVMQGFTGLFDRRTLVSTFLPACTFIALVVAVVLLGELGWTRGLKKWDDLGGTGQLVAGVAFLALVTFWTFVAAALRTAVIQCYEGYWPVRLWAWRRAHWLRHVRELRARDAGFEAREEQLLAEVRAWERLDGAAATPPAEAALLEQLSAPGAADATDDITCLERSAALRGWAVRVRDAAPEAYGDAAVERLTAALAATRAAVERRADAAARDRTVVAQELFLRFPPGDAQIMPTRLGNVLRAAEEHPRTLYGLDLAVVWPRLQQVLPAEASDQAQNARTPLDLLITVSWFSLLFGLPLTVYAAFGFALAWWGIALAVAGIAGTAYVTYRVAALAALAYGEVLKALTDLHRRKVLEAMAIKVPEDSAAERRLWRDVCRALYRGEALP